jgi:hypothetical protein
MIDERLGFGVGSAKRPVGPFGGKVFEDRRRFPENESVVLKGRNAPVRILGEVLGCARLANARIASDLGELDAELGRQQPHFAGMG